MINWLVVVVIFCLGATDFTFLTEWKIHTFPIILKIMINHD